MADIEPQTASKPPQDEEKELDLKRILAQVRTRIHLVIIFVILGAGAGAFWGQLPPNVFQAQSVVQIEQNTDRIPLTAEIIGNLPGAPRSEGRSLETEVHIIRSRLILAPVVERLNTQTVVAPVTAPIIGGLLKRQSLPFINTLLGAEYARPGEFINVSLKDLPVPYRGMRFRLKVTGDTSFEVTLRGDISVRGALGTPLALPEGGEFLVSAINAPPGREYVVYEVPLNSAVNQIRSRLSIRERGRSGVVDFTYQSGDRNDAVAILNSVIEEYINQNLSRKSSEIDQSIRFIEEQLSTIPDQLQQANADLSEFRKNRQIDDLSVGSQELVDAAVETEAQLEKLLSRKEQLLNVLTVNHPDVRRIEVEEERLQARLQEIQNDLVRVPEVEQELARLLQRVERLRTFEKQLRELVEEFRILRASAVGNIRIVEPAEMAAQVGPDRQLPIAIGAGAGLAFSFLLILGTNALRRGVDDGEAIEALGLPLFATINKSENIAKVGSSDAAYGLARHDPDSIVVESLRGLRTGIKFAMASTDANSLMITSCEPGDGKSFIALNLALVMGQTGARVLLIDADMRRGVLRKYFKFDHNRPGLSDILAGSVENCIVHIPDASIDFISTGRYPPNPSELLEGPVFQRLLQFANDNYDLVIVDAPPALVVPDPAIIGRNVGISMLVVRHLHTSPAEIQTAQKTLAMSGGRISGAILNQYDENRARYGRYSQRYGNYRYSYKADKRS